MDKFTDEEFDILLNKIPVINCDKQSRFSIIINGKTFITQKGKSVWNKRNHATCAFNNEYAYIVKHTVEDRLKNKGIYDYYRCPEYINAFNDFKDMLIEKGLFKIIELHD